MQHKSLNINFSYIFVIYFLVEVVSLLFDIFSLNDLETDSVRLSAATIKQLFEDTNYSLKDVRKNKLVKPVALSLIHI